MEKFSPMKELRFTAEAFPKVLDGSMFVTIRKDRGWIHDLKRGEVFLAQFDGSPGYVLLLQASEDTEYVPFSKLPKEVAIQDGYATPTKLFGDWKKKFYPDLKKNDSAAVIRFRILGKPVGDFLWKPRD